jgi:hypothetical protein
MAQIPEVPGPERASRRGRRAALGAGVLSMALLASGIGIAGAATAKPATVHARAAATVRASKDSSKDASKDRSSGVTERSSRDSTKDGADHPDPSSDSSYDG